MKGIRHGDCHKKRNRRRQQGCQFNDLMGGIACVERPGELRPGPPYQPEDQHRLPDRHQVEAVVQQADHLRHREDEDEVKKKFDEGCALIFGGSQRFQKHQ